jgi:hypothetical protein
MNMNIDVRHVLPAIRVPTLVLNRTEDDPDIVGGSRYLAEHIAGARHVELSGRDHAIFAGDTKPFLEEITRFLQETWGARTWEKRDTAAESSTRQATDSSLPSTDRLVPSVVPVRLRRTCVSSASRYAPAFTQANAR